MILVIILQVAGPYVHSSSGNILLFEHSCNTTIIYVCGEYHTGHRHPCVQMVLGLFIQGQINSTWRAHCCWFRKPGCWGVRIKQTIHKNCQFWMLILVVAANIWLKKYPFQLYWFVSSPWSHSTYVETNNTYNAIAWTTIAGMPISKVWGIMNVNNLYVLYLLVQDCPTWFVPPTWTLWNP